MTTLGYTANPGGPHYVAPVFRLYHMRPGGAGELALSRWKPIVVRWQCNGRISTMDIKCVLGEGEGVGRLRPEDVRALMCAGDRVRLVDVANNREWFRGYAGKMDELVQSAQDVESVTWTIYGPELRLAQKAVEGQWRKTETADDWQIAGTLTEATATRDTVFQTPFECVFNERGEPNATLGLDWKLDSAGAIYPPSAANNDCRVFEDSRREQKNSSGQLMFQTDPWDSYTALRSVVEWVDRYDIIDYASTSWLFIKATLTGAGVDPAPITDVNVHGRNLLEAMEGILNPIGYGFAFEPWAQPNGKHRLLVFSLASPSAFVQPNLGPQTPVDVTDAIGKRAVVQRLNFARDSHNVANEIIVHGDRKRVQVALDFGGGYDSGIWDMKPFWDTTTHAISNWLLNSKFPKQDYATAPTVGGDMFFDRHHKDGYNFAAYQHVYRTFSWNEDGHAAEFGWDIPLMGPYGLNDPNTSLATRRRRPMKNTLTYDGGETIPAGVWMAFVDSEGTLDASTWKKVSAEIWPDRCAFTILTPLIDKETKAPWFPWDAPEKKGPGSGTGYWEYNFIELLKNSILNTADVPKILLRFVGSQEADGVVRGVGTSVGGAGTPSKWPYTSTRVVVDTNVRFEHKAVLDTHTWPANTQDTADDSAAVQQYADALAANAGAEMGHGSIVLRHLSREYAIGHGVDGTAGRHIGFELDIAGHRFPIILGVTWTFENESNKTELVMDSPLLGLI